MSFPKLVARRTVLLPTRTGWFLLLAVFAIPASLWFFCGDQFLSITERKPADVLVVEGWISFNGISAGGDEFRQGGYRLIVATGAYSAEKWNVQRWNYGIVAAQKLEAEGVPKEKIVRAPANDTQAHRTFESAIAVAAVLKKIEPRPVNITVFTLGSHARRSRLVYAKVLGSDYKVGVISWKPPGYESRAWWQSSTRAKEFIVETLAWAYELLLNSGRFSNHLERPPADQNQPVIHAPLGKST